MQLHKRRRKLWDSIFPNFLSNGTSIDRNRCSRNTFERPEKRKDGKSILQGSCWCGFLLPFLFGCVCPDETVRVLLALTCFALQGIVLYCVLCGFSRRYSVSCCRLLVFYYSAPSLSLSPSKFYYCTVLYWSCNCNRIVHCNCTLVIAYSILFYSILFYSIPFWSLFYPM